MAAGSYHTTSAPIWKSFMFMLLTMRFLPVGSISSRLRKKADSDVTQDSWASSLIHARRRPTTKRSIQLHLRRAASSTESPAATIAEDGGCGAERAIAALCEAVCQAGPAVDCARETAAGATVAGAVHDPQRTAVDGAVGLQHVVPLVRGAEHGRPNVGCDGVHQKSRTSAEGQHRAGVFPDRAGAGTRTEPAVRRALHGGRDIDRSLGGTEEFSA